MFHIPTPSSPRRRAKLAAFEESHAEFRDLAEEVTTDSINRQRKQMVSQYSILDHKSANRAHNLSDEHVAHELAQTRLDRAMALAAAAQGNLFDEDQNFMTSSSSSSPSGSAAWAEDLFMSSSMGASEPELSSSLSPNKKAVSSRWSNNASRNFDRFADE
jgi:hypothetical protein